MNVSGTYVRCRQLFSGLKNKMYEKYENWSEMGPYGSVWADIKTGKSPMAHDHFQTLLTPKGAIKIEKIKKTHFFWPLLLSTLGGAIGM